MSMAVPLTLRLRTSSGDSDVTAKIHDLHFRTEIPGGFATAQIRLDRPLSISSADLDYYASLFVYDGRHGGVIWEGRVEDLGRGVDGDGQVWDIAAVGPQAHASDQTLPLIYCDQSLDRWKRSRYSTPGGHTETGEIDEDTPSLEVYATEGSTVTTSWMGDWIYRAMYYTGQTVARVRADTVEDGASSNYHIAVVGRIAAGTAVWLKTYNWVTVPGIMVGNVGATDDLANTWDNGINVVSLRAQRDVSNTTADEFAKAHFYNPSVRSMLKNADGSDITDPSSYAVNNVDPVEVIADLLGRVLTKYDGANATLIGSGVDLTQVAYPDGITPAGIFEDLMVFDPGFYWAAWESNTAGKHRFEYIPWPTTVRYEATTVDGFNSPGSAADLFNEVRVRWVDSITRVRTTRRTQTVDQLTAAGLTRSSFIDLGDEIGSSTNAARVGDNFLLEHRYPPNAGTLNVSRPIVDNDSGRMVQPWEILPGHLIRVGGVLPSYDSLNPTARDGVTIFKVVSVEYDSGSNTATLELDSHSRSVARALASLRGRRLRKR